MITTRTNLCQAYQCSYPTLLLWCLFEHFYNMRKSTQMVPQTHKQTNKQGYSTHKAAGETLMTVPLSQIKYPDRSRRLLARYTVSRWSALLSSTILQRATDRRLIWKWRITLMPCHMQQVWNQVKNWKCHQITLHSSSADKPKIKTFDFMKKKCNSITE